LAGRREGNGVDTGSRRRWIRHAVAKGLFGDWASPAGVPGVGRAP
jgi:hypothetical protein